VGAAVIAERMPVNGAPTLVFSGDQPALIVENTGTADIFVDYEEGELPDGGLRLASGERATLPRTRDDVPLSLYAASTGAAGEVVYYLPPGWQ
jgi:hypothetical protein